MAGPAHLVMLAGAAAVLALAPAASLPPVAPVEAVTPDMPRATVAWRAAATGVETAEMRLAPAGSAWRFRVHLVRVDVRQLSLEVTANVAPGGRVSPWTLDAAPSVALLATNAGHFDDDGPWGWVVHRGREHRPPGQGPLAMAVVVDTAGRVRLVDAPSVAAVRAAGGVREAFQSYPALLVDAQIPEPLRRSGQGVDLAHRDARLALGELPDGRLVFALTRLDAPGGERLALPVGPTIPEAAELMRALGCVRAVLLDGGISAQLLLRDSTGTTRRWPGLRSVPLGVVVVPR